jgi:hypothetical protein
MAVLVALNNPSVKVVVKRYFDMFLALNPKKNNYRVTRVAPQ